MGEVHRWGKVPRGVDELGQTGGKQEGQILLAMILRVLCPHRCVLGYQAELILQFFV